MLQIFTPDEKATILATVMSQETAGCSLRDACRSQGITLQTFLDWRKNAQRHNEFTARHENHHGVHPERNRHRQPKPETALALALKAAAVKTYPTEPEPTAAPITGPAAELIPAFTAAPPEQQAADPVIETPPMNEETPDMPKTKAAPAPVVKRRGIASALYKALPWLDSVNAKCEKLHGPCPTKQADVKGYQKWVDLRRKVMTDEQRAELSAFYKRPTEAMRATRAAKSGNAEKVQATPVQAAKPAKRAPNRRQQGEQMEMVGIAAGVVPDAIQPLVFQHAATSMAIANHEQTGLHIRVQPPRDVNNLMTENARLKQALTALTIENLQLRGIL